jgi:hypothetical protein
MGARRRKKGGESPICAHTISVIAPMNCGVAVVFNLAVSSSIIFPMLNQREAFRRSVVASSWGIFALVVCLQCLVMEWKVGGGVGWVTRRRRRKSRQEAGDALADVLPRSWGSGPKYFFWGPRTIIPQPPRKLSGSHTGFLLLFSLVLFSCFVSSCSPLPTVCENEKTRNRTLRALRATSITSIISNLYYDTRKTSHSSPPWTKSSNSAR